MILSAGKISWPIQTSDERKNASNDEGMIFGRRIETKRQFQENNKNMNFELREIWEIKSEIMWYSRNALDIIYLRNSNTYLADVQHSKMYIIRYYLHVLFYTSWHSLFLFPMLSLLSATKRCTSQHPILTPDFKLIKTHIFGDLAPPSYVQKLFIKFALSALTITSCYSEHGRWK